MSQDPSGFGGGDANLSRYCFNSPTSGIDPSGRDIMLTLDDGENDSPDAATNFSPNILAAAALG